MDKYIEYRCREKVIRIPNAWELLQPEWFLHICQNIEQCANGKLSPAMVRILYLCDVMGWNPKKITDDNNALSTLALMGERVTFIFNISYPNDIMSSLKDDERAFFKKNPPEHSSSALGRYLSKQDYNYVVDSCFCAQLIPIIRIDKTNIDGYKVDTGFGSLTCSLTALQYLEARELIGCAKEQLPLMASILYQQGIYNSEKAHNDASEFAKLSDIILRAIAFNFVSLNNYLFCKTQFSLLTASTTSKSGSSISVGALDSLYNLSSDGFGDINTIEQMNILQYLNICRKKIIDSVRTMNNAKIKITEIALNTGLPLSIINEILL